MTLGICITVSLLMSVIFLERVGGKIRCAVYGQINPRLVMWLPPSGGAHTPNATLMLHGYNRVDTTTAAWCNSVGTVLLHEYRQCYQRNLCVPTLNTIDYTVQQQVSHTMLAFGVSASVVYHQYKLASHMFQVL